MKSFVKFAIFVFFMYQIINIVILKQSWRSSDGLNIISHFFASLVLASLFGLRYSGVFLTWSLNMSRQLHVHYRAARLYMYVTCVCLLGYIFVVLIIYVTVVGTWKGVKSEIGRRFEKNIINVESRKWPFFQPLIHVIPRAYFPPKKLYRGEDAICVSGTYFHWEEKNFKVKAFWMKKGKPLPSSKRFSVFVNVTDETEHFSKIIPEGYGFRIFRIILTLTIYSVEADDFGSYTGHVQHTMRLSFRDENTKEEKLEEVDVSIVKSSNRFKRSLEEEMKRHAAEKTTVKEKMFMLKDIYGMTPFTEFTLVEIRRSQIIVHAPPGAILTFTTTFKHLNETSKDIVTDYFINGEPAATGMCGGLFKGCSKFLMLYLFFSSNYSSVPPFFETVDTVQNFDLSLEGEKITKYYHCVCHNTYGVHTVYYRRRVYNSSTGKHELLETRHPDELLVLPREQDMLNFFQTEPSHVVEKPLVALSPQDMGFVKMAATFAASKFDEQENLFIGLGLVLGLLVLVLIIFLLVR